MLTDIQERVAEYVYKARINPAAAAPPPQQRQQPVGAGVGGGAGGGFFGSSIAGPGIGQGPPPKRPPSTGGPGANQA